MAEHSRFAESVFFVVFLCPQALAQTTPGLFTAPPVNYASAGIITACVVGGLLMLFVLLALLARLCKPCVSKEKKQEYDVREQWNGEGAARDPSYHVNRAFEPNIPQAQEQIPNNRDIHIPTQDYDTSIPRVHSPYETTIPRQDHYYDGYVPEPSHAPMRAQPMIDIPAVETEDPRAPYAPDPVDLYRYDQPHLGPDVNESDGWVTYQFSTKRR